MQPATTPEVAYPSPLLQAVVVAPQDTASDQLATGSAEELLQDADLVSAAKSVLVGLLDHPCPDGARANKLLRMLLVRLKLHIATKVSDPAKRVHPVWEWCEQNAHRVAAMIELQGDARTDMNSVGRKAPC